MKYLIVGILLIFNSRSIFSQSSEDFYDMAEEKIEQKDYQYAALLIDKAIQLNDTNIWYWLKKSEIQLEMADSYLALVYIKKAISMDTAFSESYNRAGGFFSSRGLIDSSIYMYNKAIQHAENDTIRYSYIANRGGAKVAKRDFEAALIDYEAALAFDTNDIGALNNIALIYREVGAVNKAIKYLKKIISLDSTFIGTYANLGFIYSKIDSLDLSIQYFNKALAIDSNEAITYNNRGFAYYKMKKYKMALRDVNKSIGMYPSNSYAYKNLALIYIATENIYEACNALNYAKNYGYTSRYGNEVKVLIDKYCKN